MRILHIFVALAVLTSWTVDLRAATLTLWDHENGAFNPALDNAIQTFAARHSGHEVRRRRLDKDTLIQEFLLGQLHGQKPDLVVSQQDFAATLVTQGALQTVDAWFQARDVFTSLVAPVQDERGIWGVPLSGSQTLLLFLNRKLIPTPPQSLEQLLATAERIADQRRNVFGLSFPVQDPLWFGSFASAFSKSGQALAWDPAATRQTLSLFKDLTAGGVIPTACDYTCAENLFLNSQAAMMINGDWAREKYTELFQDNLVVTPLPRSETTGRAMAAFTSGRYLFAAKELDGEKRELAKAFAKILLEEQRQRSWAIESGIPPALKVLADDPSVTRRASLAASVQAMAHDVPYSLNDDVRRRWGALKAPLEKALLPGEGIDVGVKKLQRAVEVF